MTERRLTAKMIGDAVRDMERYHIRGPYTLFLPRDVALRAVAESHVALRPYDEEYEELCGCEALGPEFVNITVLTNRQDESDPESMILTTDPAPTSF